MGRYGDSPSPKRKQRSIRRGKWNSTTKSRSPRSSQSPRPQTPVDLDPHSTYATNVFRSLKQRQSPKQKKRQGKKQKKSPKGMKSKKEKECQYYTKTYKTNKICKISKIGMAREEPIPDCKTKQKGKKR